MTPIEAVEISTSYRRICNRDHEGVADKHHAPEQRKLNKGSDQCILAVRINDTLDAIEKEQKVHALNLPNFGVVAEQFICSLARIFQWERPLSSFPSSDKRQGLAKLVAQFLLGALDFADDPFRHQLGGLPVGEAASTFMIQVFGRLDPGKAVWFQAVEEEEWFANGRGL